MSVRWSHVIAYLPPKAWVYSTFESRSDGASARTYDDIYAMDPGATGSYRGIQYLVRRDYSITADIDGQELTWPYLNAFRKWVEEERRD
jgi:hypothetical protein